MPAVYCESCDVQIARFNRNTAAAFSDVIFAIATHCLVLPDKAPHSLRTRNSKRLAFPSVFTLDPEGMAMLSGHIFINSTPIEGPADEVLGGYLYELIAANGRATVGIDCPEVIKM